MINNIIFITLSIITILFTITFFNKEHFQTFCNDNNKYGVNYKLTLNNPYIYYNSNTEIIPTYTVYDQKVNNYSPCFIGRKVYLGYIDEYTFPLYFYITSLNSSKGYNGYILDSNGSTLRKVVSSFNSSIPVKLKVFTT